MLAALVLVCALVLPVHECDQRHARNFLRVPGTFGHPVTCFLHAQAFLAEMTDLELGNDEYVRVVCIRSVNPNIG